MADLYGDELSLRKDIAVVDSAQTSQVLGLVVRYIREANNGASPLHLARMIAQGLLAVILTGIDIQRVASGKIAENWVNLDALGLLQQLGVVPPPGQASS